MKIILGKTAGFCYGVKRAVDGARLELEKDKNIYCLGEIVHNKSIVQELEKNGMNFIDNIENAKGKTIIRAHGVSKDIYKKLEEKEIEIVDLTCPNVVKTHKLADEYRKKNFFIILVGIKNHPESIGTLSFCGNNAFLIQEKDEIESLIQKINLKNILIMAQTTYNSKKFDDIVSILQKKLFDKNIEVKKTICDATEIRQKETIKISKQVDSMIIVGDKKSSNTNKLYDIAKENCTNVFFIQNAKELEKEKLKNFEKIGIMAGASTPNTDIEEVINKLEE